MFDPSLISRFPVSPGVYLMKDRQGKILYIGKANNLRQRVKQYFNKSGDTRAMIPFLVQKVDSVDTIVVSSEKEALLLENNLIKDHQPPYNILLKDDKSYICLKLTTEKKWPMLEIVRYRGSPKGKGRYFGPYTGVGAARKTFDLLNRIFPLRQCSDQDFHSRDRPCILYQMKRCLAPCVGYCNKDEYETHVNQAIQFLEGKDKDVVARLYQRMEASAEALEFERAGELLQLIRYIEKTVEQQKVERLGGTSADVIALYRQADEVSIALLYYRKGRLTGSVDFLFSNVVENDEELVQRFLLQRYFENKETPPLLLVPVSLEEKSLVEEVVGTTIQFPKRGDKRAILQMAEKNAQAAFTRKKDAAAIAERTMLEMQNRFSLAKPPRRIECFDTSHLGGEEPVAAMVCFVDGEKQKDGYRRYKIKEAKGGDDYGAMEEVLRRRYQKLSDDTILPDLLVIDGGKGHLNMALRVLKELNIISIQVIGLAKEEHRHDKGMSREQVFLSGIKDPLLLPRNSSTLFLLQKIRDEAHRFAITFQRKRRSKKAFTSELSKVPGIGPKKEKKLLQHFGSVRELKKLSVETIASLEGISKENAESVVLYLKKK